jgi:hypothetical protein
MDREPIVAVNGGIGSVAGAVVDVWVLNARSALDATIAGEKKALHCLMLAQGAGRHARGLVLLTKDDQAAAHTLKALTQQGTTWGAVVEVNQGSRREIEAGAGARTPDLTKHALSAGMFAAAACFWAGAATVRLEGFSWRGGYQYLPGTAISRGHEYGDKRALALLGDRYGARLEHALHLPPLTQESAPMATRPTRPATHAASTTERFEASDPTPEPAPPPQRPYKVRALKLLQYGLRRRRPGDVFLVAPGHFRARQMEHVSDATPEHTTTPAQAGRLAEAQVLATKTPQLQPNGADLVEDVPTPTTGAANLDVI